MARYRNVSTDFWLDPFVLDLTPEEKYFYIYLMTNKHATFCGIYTIHKKVMEMETGYNRETVEKLLDRFEQYQKLLYDGDNNEIMMLNWVKYNQPNNLNVVKGIVAELKEVKTITFINIYIKLALGITTKDEHADMLINTHKEILEGATKGLDRGYQVIEIEIESEIESEIEIENKTVIDTDVPMASKKETKTIPVKRELIPYNDIVSLYNEICGDQLSKVQVVSDARKRAIKTMWNFAKKDIELFRTIFLKVIDSDFASGRTGAWTSCNFDWLMKKNNAIKVIEGNYDNRGPSGPGGKQSLTEELQSQEVQDWLNS